MVVCPHSLSIQHHALHCCCRQILVDLSYPLCHWFYTLYYPGWTPIPVLLGMCPFSFVFAKQGPTMLGQASPP